MFGQPNIALAIPDACEILRNIGPAGSKTFAPKSTESRGGSCPSLNKEYPAWPRGGRAAPPAASSVEGEGRQSCCVALLAGSLRGPVPAVVIGDFEFLARRDPHDLDGVADHVGGAPLGPIGKWGNLHKRSDQAQQRLMFWSIRFVAQEGHQIDMGKPTTRWGVRLMNDEGPAVSRLAREKPGVPVRAPIQFPPI